MTIDVLLSRLQKVKSRGEGKWIACCPAHEDKSPSLAIAELSDGRILLHCHAACPVVAVLACVGLRMSDLFPKGALGEFRGFEQVKRSLRKPHDNENTILAIAKGMRDRGERLSREDMEREKIAWMRVNRRETVA